MDLKALGNLLHEIVTYGRIATETGRLHALIDDVLAVAEDATAGPTAGNQFYTPVT